MLRFKSTLQMSSSWYQKVEFYKILRDEPKDALPWTQPW